jgi:hypothetical protein
LHLLSFIFPNQDISRGYGGFKRIFEFFPCQSASPIGLARRARAARDDLGVTFARRAGESFASLPEADFGFQRRILFRLPAQSMCISPD